MEVTPLWLWQQLKRAYILFTVFGHFSTRVFDVTLRRQKRDRRAEGSAHTARTVCRILFISFCCCGFFFFFFSFALFLYRFSWSTGCDMRVKSWILSGFIIKKPIVSLSRFIWNWTGLDDWKIFYVSPQNQNETYKKYSRSINPCHWKIHSQITRYKSCLNEQESNNSEKST